MKRNIHWLLIVPFFLLLTQKGTAQQFRNIVIKEAPEYMIQKDYDIQMIKQLMSVRFDPMHFNNKLFNQVKNNYFIAEYYLGKIRGKIDLLYTMANIKKQEEAYAKRAINQVNHYDMSSDMSRDKNPNPKIAIQGGTYTQEYLLTQLYNLYKIEFNDLLQNYINPKGYAIVYYTSLFGYVNEVGCVAEATNNFNVGYYEVGGMTQRQYKIKILNLFFNKFFFSNGNAQTPTVPVGAAISFLHILS